VEGGRWESTLLIADVEHCVVSEDVNPVYERCGKEGNGQQDRNFDRGLRQHASGASSLDVWR
jgi:hypothetical protein